MYIVKIAQINLNAAQFRVNLFQGLHLLIGLKGEKVQNFVLPNIIVMLIQTYLTRESLMQ